MRQQPENTGTCSEYPTPSVLLKIIDHEIEIERAKLGQLYVLKHELQKEEVILQSRVLDELINKHHRLFAGS